ncbi:MAG: cytochrome c3 family protein [Deltaproteobacteria bacterium]|nr:cytochrome c3 family protein [Candidatus Anaeroferrophillus wilburensis]MBN2889157.1 cytochrome c3 family protein [Deltaproteobacteria bacterium]
MKKNYGIGLLFGAVLVIAFALPLWAQPETIVLNNLETFTKKERPAVLFPHERHLNALECADCHHRYEKGENVLDEDTLEEGNAEIRCAHCHNWKARQGLRQAFHRSCTGCHKVMAAAGKTTGPRTCGGCHVVK